MTFSELKKALQRHFEEMTADAEHLFEVDVDKDELWNLYLDSFPAGTNEIYRERREYDCSCCRQFIKAIGNAVVIKDNQVHTIWGFQTGDSTFQPVVDALDMYIKQHPVSDRYFTDCAKIGTDKNYETMLNGSVHVWEHFYLELPNKFVNRSGRSAGDVKGEYRAAKEVFKRSLDEITLEAVDTVLELIAQNSLYRGAEWKNPLESFRKLHVEYHQLPNDQRDNFAWAQSAKAGPAISRIRNHSIGTLLVNISEDMDLDLAVRKYESIVAPENYQRPKAIYTKKMLEEAKKTVEDLGYLDSLERRYATLDDISVNNILFANRDAVKRITGGNIFDEMMQEASVDPKKFSKSKEISIGDFVKNVLPTAKSVEVLLEPRHAANLVSLIAPVHPESKSMFKWGNGFSWAYAGNLTDSSIRENVKSAGGKVDGVLRFSIQWNDTEYDQNDLDAHCITPSNEHIFFGERHGLRTGGMLDVDIIHPKPNVPAVENITWASKSKMTPGRYQFFVKCYSNLGGRSGFRAEVECDGMIYSFEYKSPLHSGEIVRVAEVSYNPVTGFTVTEKLPANVSSREMWGLKSNQFVPVSVICYSPNCWDDQKAIGNRHYMFMLKDCINPERPNGFYNEFLDPALIKHKRVFEALGNKMAVQESDDQLSGLGFASTKRNYLIVRVQGATDRILKVTF